MPDTLLTFQGCVVLVVTHISIHALKTLQGIVLVWIPDLAATTINFEVCNVVPCLRPHPKMGVPMLFGKCCRDNYSGDMTYERLNSL